MRSFFVSMGLVLAVLSLTAATCGDNGGNQPGADASPKVDAAVDAPANTPSCTDYCTQVMAACTGDNQQYDTMADCTNSCQHFMLGTADDSTMNTVGCRTTHAKLAVDGPATHCPHAGPGGDGQCGNVCGSYCRIAIAVCPDQAGGMSKCMTDCGAYPSGETKYKAPFADGNTAECRLYHATRAANDSMQCKNLASGTTPCTNT